MSAIQQILAGLSRSAITAWDFANGLDSSGSGLHLTLAGYGVPATASDPWGIGQNALTLNGTQHWAAQGTGYDISSNGDYTFECRFKRNTANNGTVQILFARWGDSASSSNLQYLCYFDASNTLNFLHRTAGGTNVAVTSGAITDGSSHAVAVVRSSNTLSLYVDGTRVAGPTAVTTTQSVGAAIPFRVGDYDDGELPYFGTLGDIRFSNSARYTGASYTVPTSPFTTDANTVALLKLDAVRGTYFGTPTYQGNLLTRAQFATATGGTDGAGGLANPDGPLPTLDGKWFYSVAAYSNATSKWSEWAVIANTVAELLAGTGTVQAAAFQTAGAGSINGNGTVLAFGGTYWHWFQNDTPQICYSTGSSLGSAFSSPTALFNGYDPWVRIAPDGITLEMFYCEVPNGPREWKRRTSTDGTTWSSATVVANPMTMPGYLAQHPGEPSAERLSSTYLGLQDGAAVNGERVVLRRVSPNGTDWLALKKFMTPAGGSYVTVYDSSPYYDTVNNRIVVLAANSTNTQVAQPTDSDIGWWTAAINVGGTSESTTTLFTDNFNRANTSLGGVANGWSDPTTSWQITSNRVIAPSNGFATKYLTQSASITNDARLFIQNATLDSPDTASLVGLLRSSGTAGCGVWLGLGNLTAGDLSGATPAANSLAFSGTGPNYDLELIVSGTEIIGSVFEVGGTTPLSVVSYRSGTYTSGSLAFTPLNNNNSADAVTVTTTTQTRLMVADGDSITLGVNNTGWLPMALRVKGLAYRGRCIGVNGQTLGNFTSPAPSNQTSRFAANAAPLISAATVPVIYWTAGGTNDIYYNRSAAQLQSDLTALVATAAATTNANGTATKVGVNTLLYRNDFPGTSTIAGSAAAQRATFRSIVDTFNTWLRANYVSIGATYLADWAAIGAMSDPDSGTSPFQSDKVHPDFIGERYLGESIAAVL